MLLSPCFLVEVTTLNASRAYSEMLKLVADSTAHNSEQASFSTLGKL